jgi:transposase-like protein
LVTQAITGAAVVRSRRIATMLAKRRMTVSSIRPTAPGICIAGKYLNNLIEQDHRGIKSRTRLMLSFKNFDYAAITIAGV